MTWQVCDVRWAEPAIRAFLAKYGPEDADAVNSILIQVREHPEDLSLRELVAPEDLRPEIDRVEGDVYRSTDGVWEVYFNWSPLHITVVFAEKARSSKR